MGWVPLTKKNKSDEQVLFHNNSWHRKMSRFIFSTDFSLRRSVCRQAKQKIGAPLMQISQSLILHDLCESAR
jgi:hypothetical protein